MPLIFVHGVSVRKDKDFAKLVNARDALFRQFVLSSEVGVPKNGLILNPYWGDKGAKFYWGHASLPTDGIEALGAEDEDAILLIAESRIDRIVPETVFLDLARTCLKDAVDLLGAASITHLVEGLTAEWASIASLAINYANDNERPAWLGEINDDQQFLTRFQQEIEAYKVESQHALVGTVEAQEWEALGNRGVWSHFREGMARLRGALGRTTGSIFVDIARLSLHKSISTFIGDVLVYLKERGDTQNPGPIVQEIVSTLDYARTMSRTAPNEKLIVIAHSMGGNIAYDVLTYFRPDIEIDLFVTVGSQVGLFEELKLFVKSDKSVPADPKSDLIEKPSNVGRWINIFDENDILGFALKRIFTDVSEYKYSTGKGAIGAHSNYFAWPSFHERLSERILEAYK